MKPGRILAMVVLVAVLAWLGWLVVFLTRMDELAATDPVAALRLDPDNPIALQARALQQLAGGDDADAMATARHLLRVAPGQGDAFAVIALAAVRQGSPEADSLLQIAAQRAPRTAQVRAQLAALRLKEGDVPKALKQIDALLRFEPARGQQILPAMAAQSADPRFADAMATMLAGKPPWRQRFLDALNSGAPPAANNNIYSRLLQKGGLSAVETRRWLDGLMAQGRWGDAFAAWFGTLHPTPTHLPSVRNGGFEDEIDGVGFGWRDAVSPGVFTDIEAGAGIRGSRAAHMQFIGRPAPRGNLRQALLLVPGRYRLSMQARADALHSEVGMTWVVRCDSGPQIAVSEPLEGSFDWRTVAIDFPVPAAKCDGQWLELRNAAVGASAQQVQGDLWIDDVTVTPLRR